MTVKLTRSGGFAGMVLERDGDLDEAPDAVREAAEHLVENAASLQDSPGGHARDTRQYELLFRQGRRKTSFVFDERSLPDEARQVVEYLMNQ